mmetsp:Transcript_60852/g.145037  ORF Transcript_60852/g.145037 Transcript_60852/m.145037 type:complete len:318 (-) Transcript_60852:77-1030(-)
MNSSDRMFLEDGCSLLKQELLRKLVDDQNCIVPDQDIQDFEVCYSISAQGDTLTMSVWYAFLQEVLRKGSQQLLERVWSGLPLKLKVELGCLHITVNPSSFGPDQAERERCANLLAMVRMLLLTGPLVERLRYMRDMKPGATEVAKPTMLQVRPMEWCWLISKVDRVVAIFAIHMANEVDIALGRAFCQEFAETNRKPNEFSLPCTFRHPQDPPIEIRDLEMPEVPNVGFLSLSLSAQCVKGADEERLHALAKPVMTLRNFFHFHIKNAKTYLHSRLRKRLDGWQDQLKKARRPPRRSPDRRRTASGVLFTPEPRAA